MYLILHFELWGLPTFFRQGPADGVKLMGFIIRNRLTGTEIKQPGHEVAEDAPVIEQHDERPAKLLTLTGDVAEYELHPLDQSIDSGVAQSYHNGADGTV